MDPVRIPGCGAPRGARSSRLDGIGRDRKNRLQCRPHLLANFTHHGVELFELRVIRGLGALEVALELLDAGARFLEHQFAVVSRRLSHFACGSLRCGESDSRKLVRFPGPALPDRPGFDLVDRRVRQPCDERRGHEA